MYITERSRHMYVYKCVRYTVLTNILVQEHFSELHSLAWLTKTIDCTFFTAYYLLLAPCLYYYVQSNFIIIKKIISKFCIQGRRFISHFYLPQICIQFIFSMHIYTTQTHVVIYAEYL